MLPKPILHQSKTEYQSRRPETEEKKQQQRSEVSQKILLPRHSVDAASNVAPRNPGTPVEPSRQPEMPRYPARQHHRLNRIQQHLAEDNEAENGRDRASVKAHGNSQLRCPMQGRVTDS